MSQRYEIREAIGQGGLGSVYKAFDTQLQREVAMKRVLTAGQGTEEEVQLAGDKLIAEAQTLSSLNHPNIITVFDVGRDEKGGFVVMELLDGETLDETVERGVLTGADFREVVFQTMEGLIAAQAADVIHRDIKPTNIMLIWQASGRFQLKILDFGLAKFSRSPSVQTMDQDEAVMGSIFFMAPEQFERAELDARTDLYQMGCVYYNALTGQYPFNGETAPQVMNAHLQHKVVPLEQLRPDLPPALCQWVMWLINRDISSRPANAKEALQFFPKDQASAPALPAQAVVLPTGPVINTPNVKIATPTGTAKAPPNLIVGGAPAPRPGAQPIQSVSRPQTTQPAAKKKGINPVVLTTIICSSIMLIIGLVYAVNKMGETKRTNRLTELSEDPTGSASDVSLLVEFLTGDDYSATQKNKAYQALLDFEGDEADESILKGLKEAPTATYRKHLANIISNRGYQQATPTLLRYAASASDSADKVEFLRAAKPLANIENFDAILGSLKNANSSTRPIYQDILATIVRGSARTDKQVSTIRSRLTSVKGEEKRSLYSVLGLLGGKDTKTQLDEIFSGSDLNEKEMAFAAINAWPNRDLLDLTAKIIQSNDKSLRRPAARAYTNLCSKPGAVTIDQRIKDWQRGFKLMNTNPQERSFLINSTYQFPHPKMLALTDTWQKNEKFKNISARVAAQIKSSIKTAPTLNPGGKLPAAKAAVIGSNGWYDSDTDAINSWTSPSTYFTWTFKAAKSGEYSIAVEQANGNSRNSEFIIFVNGSTFEGSSSSTKSYEDFQTVSTRGKKVKLEANNYYHLILTAGSSVQPRMMNIRSVILKK